MNAQQSGLLTQNMTPEQARLLDQQLRQKQFQGKDYGGGALGGFLTSASGAIQGAAGAGQGLAERFGAERQVGANEASAQASQAAAQASKTVDSQIQAVIAGATGEEYSDKLKAAAAKLEQSSNPRALAKAAELREKAMEAVIEEEKIKLQREGLALQGVRADETKAQNIQENAFKERELTAAEDAAKAKFTRQDVGKQYGIVIKDLSTEQVAELGSTASKLKAEGATATDIKMALNQAIALKADTTKKDGVAVAIRATDSMLDIAREAQKLIPESFVEAAVDAVTGFFGVPWTEGVTLANHVKKLQSGLAFDRLIEMKQASPTGGALGSVSNIELELLKSSLTALDVKDENFNQQLEAVIDHYSAFADTLRGKMPESERYKTRGGKIYRRNTRNSTGWDLVKELKDGK